MPTFPDITTPLPASALRDQVIARAELDHFAKLD